MQVDVYKIDGALSGEKVELDANIFEIEPNDHAIYQAVRSIQANQRQGTHKVKTRSEVRGGGRKPFKQKKTGRARAGTTRSPLWVGGGSIFGPTPHDYVIKLPLKVRKLARKSALSYKAKDGAVKVVEDFQFDEVKTKKMSAVLKALLIDKQKTLLLTKTTDGTLLKSGRNIPKLQVREADKASTFEILKNQVLLIQKSAVDVLQKIFEGLGQQAMVSILVRPIITEKMTELGDKRQYAFEVPPSVNKIEVCKAVEKKFNVKVTSVRTVIVKGKRKNQMTKRGRFEGHTKTWKKAIVTLKEGDKIDYFGNV